MINIKENKGITLVSLIVTIIILLILTGTGIYNYTISNETVYYNKMISDIKLLNDKILVYYNKYENVPKTDREITVNGIVYYEIDLTKLEGVTLNYGNQYGETITLSDTSDVYVVNDNLKVYYLKGVEKSGEIYHSNEDISLDLYIKVVSGTKNYDGTYITEVELQFVQANEENIVSKTEFSVDNGNKWEDISTLDNNIYKISEDGTYNIIARSYDKEGNILEEYKMNIKAAILKIGDKFAYNEGVGKTTTIDSDFVMDDLEWRILDIEDDGTIELISTNPTTSTLTLSGEEDWLYGDMYLNTLCNELYGSGVGAIEARNLKIEDINKLINTGYNPVPDEKRWQYRYSGTQIQYRNSTDGGVTWGPGTTDEGWTNLSSTYKKFKEPGKDIIDSEDDEPADLIANYYGYKISTRITSKIENNTIALSDFLSKGEDSSDYINQWLASKCFAANTSYGGIFRIQVIHDGEVKPANVFYSHGGKQTSTINVRPVVILKPNLKLTQINGEWQIIE